MSTTTTTTRTIHTAAAELTAAGYETHITRDGWLCVYGPQTAYWEAWFSPNDGNDVTVGEVPQAVFDLAYFEITPRYTVSNAFEIYGDPLPEECTAETLEQTMLEMATRMACVWGTADADGMVDISAHLQGRDEREESQTGVSDEINHSNSILDVAEENGGKIAFAELVLFIKCDALEVEENEQN